MTGRWTEASGCDLLDVEVAAVLGRPSIGPAGVGGRDADYAEHGRDRYLEVFAPEDVAVSYIDDLVAVADAGAAEPAGHGAVRAAEVGVADGVDIELAYVDGKHLSRFGAVDVDAATGRVTSAKLGRKLFLLRVALQPRTAVDLRLDLELLARVDVQGGLVVRAGLEVEDLFGGALHRSTP